MTTICFIGAGSVNFTRDLVANILQYPALAMAKLRLHDIDETRLRTAGLVAESAARQLGATPQISTHLNRREALEGAQYVINSVLVGGTEASRADLALPAQLGLRQTVGDSLGIGGIFRALRTFPVLQALASDMLEVCPAAVLLNYTNPMAMNVGYLARIAPNLKAFGLCHSVHNTIVELSGLMNVPFEDISWRSAGVNHQAWVLSMERNGVDLYPLLDDKISSDPELRHHLRVDMYRRLGYFPTESSKHNSEYVAWYLKHSEERERLRLPSVDDRLRKNEEDVETFEHTKDLLESGAEVPIKTQVTEYAPQIIHSMVTGTQRRIQVNTVNTGLIANLPAGAPVEVTASVDELGVHPWYMGALPLQCAAMNRSYLNVVELTIEAAVAEDARAIRHAAMLDPNTAATLTVDQIWDLCNALVATHGSLLPIWARTILELTP